MATISLDLRQRILKAYDRGDATREQVARRFEVSLGMVKKLISQRTHTGDIAPRHHRSGRNPMILKSHRTQLKKLLEAQPDLTLEELRSHLGLECTVQAIFYVLADMGMTYKKRRFAPPSKIARMSSGRVAVGAKLKADSIPKNWSSSTNLRPKQT